jgi:hypothetical protein
MSTFHKDANIPTNAPQTEVWREQISPDFAARIMAVATEILSVHRNDPRTLCELAGDAIDCAYSWSSPRRQTRYPDTYAVGRVILRMVAREGIDPTGGPT